MAGSRYTRWAIAAVLAAALVVGIIILAKIKGRGVLTEFAMSPGDIITATTDAGTIKIRADSELDRSYTWAGATRSVTMWRRHERWLGSLGLYYPGPGDHWKEHDGITRGVLEEGQQHFKTEAEFHTWLSTERKWMSYVYSDDGLVVGWRKTPERRQLNVEVWRITINGNPPSRLQGSRNDLVIVNSRIPATNPTTIPASRPSQGTGE